VRTAGFNMRMRSLLTLLCLAPALASAQLPPAPPAGSPPPSPGSPPTAVPTSPRMRTPPPSARQPGGTPQVTAAPARPAAPPATAPTSPVRGAAPGGPRAAPAAAEAPEPGTSTFTPVRGGSGCVPIQGRFLLAFNKAELLDVLEQASRWTCRNFLYAEDVAKGKITLLSKTAVTADEAYAAFLASLTSNGLAIYPTGKYWKLVRIGDAKKVPLPTYTGDGATPADEQPITRLIRLRYADADQVRGIMGNFISPQGADLQSVPPDLLIITDISLNIRRIEKLIESIDRSGSGEVIRLIQVRHAAAKDLADKINQIFAQGASAPGRGRRSLLAGRPAAPGAPGTGAPAAPAAAVDVQVTKIIPDDRTNKLIVVADEKSFERIAELVAQLDVPTADAGGIHVIYLKNASAEELATTLSNLAQGKSGRTTPGASPTIPVPGAPQGPNRPPAASGGGSAVTAELFTGDVKVTADKAQNALVVQASGADIAVMRRLVDKLDRPRRQVFVEAVIMEVNLNNQTEFGVGGHGAVPVTLNGKTGFIPVNMSPGRINTVGTLSNVASLVSLGGFLTGFSGPVSASLKDLGLNIPSLGVMVQALQTSSDVNVISMPHIVASDNEESEITVGQNVPFQAGYTPSGLSGLLGSAGANANSTTSALTGLSGLSGLIAPIQRQNVELKLKIKPQINEGDNVRLQIDEQTEEIASTDPTLGPTTAKRTVKTQIVVKDQTTIVIGGLIQERSVRSVKKIPLLGSLPILGWLFRDTSTTKTKTTLLLFLTPYIIRDQADYRRIYEIKRKEQQDFVEQFYGRRPGYDVAIDFSRKAGLYSRLHRDVQDEVTRPENGGPGNARERVVGPEAPPPGAPARVPAPAPVPAPPPAAVPAPAPATAVEPASPAGEVLETTPLRLTPEPGPPSPEAPLPEAPPAPPGGGTP